MFYGTRWFYKVLYFITAMSPAYLLFLLQIDNKFHHPLDFEVRVRELDFFVNIYWWCGFVFFASLVLTVLLKKLLVKQYKQSSTDQILAPEKDYFKENNIEERNGNVISFLLGNILPAVFILEENLLQAIIVFIIIQILIYVLIMRSTDIFPNIVLIMMGINLCKTKNNKYVFTFKSEKFEEFKVYILGDSFKTKTHITMYKK